MPASATDLGQLVALGLSEGRQVFWLDNPYSGFLVLGALQEKYPAKTFLCIQLGASLGHEDIVLVRFNQRGHSVEPVRTQIRPSDMSYGSMVAAYNPRLRFWDIIYLIISSAAKRAGLEGMDYEIQYPRLAQQPRLVKQSLQAVLDKAKWANAFSFDDTQCAVLRNELDHHSYVHKARVPERAGQLEVWIYDEVMYQLTFGSRD